MSNLAYWRHTNISKYGWLKKMLELLMLEKQLAEQSMTGSVWTSLQICPKKCTSIHFNTRPYTQWAFKKLRFCGKQIFPSIL